MRRIFGLETEFGIVAVGPHGRALGPDQAARALFAPIVAEHRASSVFMTNGSRLYLDVGSHPEYATAECASITDVIAHDRAGEAIVADLAAQAGERLSADGEPTRLVLLKNNTDAHGNSYGTHENYLVARRDDFAAFGAALLGFLVTRQLVAGAGAIEVVDGRARYVMSQRARHMHDGVSSATTRARPMINTRDEPHADPRKHRRLHVIVGDATMTDTTTLLKLGTTDLVLRALEERGPQAFADLALADESAAIRATSLDARAPLERRSGGTITALELQAEWRSRVVVPGDGELAEAASWWDRALAALEADAPERLVGVVDWATKRSWLERVAERSGVGLADPRLRRMDLAYHEITPGGIARMLEDRGELARIATPEAIERARTQPPEGTRAGLRAQFVAAARRHERAFEVDWARLAVTDLEGGTVLCPDPFAVTDPRVDALIERMANEPRGGHGFRFADPPPV